MRSKQKVGGDGAREAARCVLPANPTLAACPGHLSWAGSTATGRVWHRGTQKREASAPEPQRGSWKSRGPGTAPGRDVEMQVSSAQSSQGQLTLGYATNQTCHQHWLPLLPLAPQYFIFPFSCLLVSRHPSPGQVSSRLSAEVIHNRHRPVTFNLDIFSLPI